MKKLSSLVLLCALFSVPGYAQTFREWQDPQLNAVNREPMRANFFAYSYEPFVGFRKIIRERGQLNGDICADFLTERELGFLIFYFQP